MNDLSKAGLTEEPPKTLLEALLAFQRDATDLKLGKDATNPHFKSKYLTLEKLHDAVMPLLAKHELVWVTRPGITIEMPDTIVLRYRLNFKDEETGGDLPLLGATDMQKLGSAITYARRYALLSVLGLVADEDDDGEAAVAVPEIQRAQAVPPRKPRVINRAEGEQLMTELTDSGATVAQAYEYADVDPAKGITHEQALKIRHLIKERGERDNA